MAMMAPRIVVRETFTLEQLVYVPNMEVPPEEWLRLPQRERCSSSQARTDQETVKNQIPTVLC
jgi:hypothetical protein